MPTHNELGPVADTYSELQAIELLRQARDRHPLPVATAASTLRAVLQAAEVALWNLADLATRAADDINREAFGPASVKYGWSLGFHEVLVNLAKTWHTLFVDDAGTSTAVWLSVTDSPALRAYVQALETFDAGLLRMVESGRFDVDEILRTASMDDNRYRLIHAVRLAGHEAREWEAGLSGLPLVAGPANFDDLVAPAILKRAVFERALSGDTFFLQFRGLHQINEILVEEANHYLAVAIRAVHASAPVVAFRSLQSANVLVSAAVEALKPMTRHLATSDYHAIRANLGLTSGSHSVALYYHLFRDLQAQMVEALRPGDDVAPEGDESELESWARCLLREQARMLGAAIDEWRLHHLQLPRNNLGTDGTRSLIGSADGVTAAQKLREAGRRNVLPGSPSTGKERAEAGPGPVRQHLDSALSLERRLLAETGTVTRSRFSDVQARKGLFSGSIPFTPPLRWRVGDDPEATTGDAE